MTDHERQIMHDHHIAMRRTCLAQAAEHEKMAKVYGLTAEEVFRREYMCDFPPQEEPKPIPEWKRRLNERIDADFERYRPPQYK